MCRTAPSTAFALTIWVLSVASPVAAAPILDQVVPANDPTSGFAIISSQSISQSFTAGLSGLLSSVDVSLYQNPGTTGDVTLRILTDATNLGSSLFSTTIPLASIPVSAGTFVSVDVSSGGILVDPGNVLAIALSRTGGASSIPWVIWNFAAAPYAGGTAYSNFGGTFQTTGSDVAFRTYVDVAQVPEPTLFGLLAIGVAGTLRRRLRS